MNAEKEMLFNSVLRAFRLILLLVASLDSDFEKTRAVYQSQLDSVVPLNPAKNL